MCCARQVVMALAATALSSCGTTRLAPTDDDAGARARLPAGAIVPDCSPPDGCPDDGLDPSRCVDDPALFRPTVLAGRVVAVEVDAAELDSAGLAPGRWHTAYPAPDGGCERVVTTFVAPEVGP